MKITQNEAYPSLDGWWVPCANVKVLNRCKWGHGAYQHFANKTMWRGREVLKQPKVILGSIVWFPVQKMIIGRCGDTNEPSRPLGSERREDVTPVTE
jgi:hypothetical protein